MGKGVSSVMRRFFSMAIFGALAICSLAVATRLSAQTPAPDQSKPDNTSPKPAQPSQSSANPFPEDTSNVPVMPSKSTPALPEGSENAAEKSAIPLPGDDFDPVHSPDDPEPVVTNANPGASSSSLAGLEKLLPRPDDDQPSQKRKLVVKQPTHQEAASKDIEVGGYYLETKNWKGALSRFESAMVLDPENPDVYWGLAEADRHLGNLADARANYQKVAEYDPDSRHGKEAIKALKEPEIANGKNPAVSQMPATVTQQ